MSVTEFLPQDAPFFNPDSITRRDVLRLGTGIAAIAAIDNAPWLLKRAAEMCDVVASPEDIVPGPVPVLEPRANNTPSVEPEECADAFTLRATCSERDEILTLSLGPAPALWAEHTNAPVNPDESFTAAGTAIITTAEGPKDGKQEYCTLFTDGSPDGQVLAVGFEGGLYFYERGLGQGSKDGTTGEWVRVLGQTKDYHLPSPAFINPSLLLGSSEMLVQKVIKGTETLRNIGYRPWAAVLPSTQMPDMITKDLTAENCAQTAREIYDEESTKNYFISQKGDFIDTHHMQGKAEQTLQLFIDLLAQRAAGVERPTASISYGAGSEALFEYEIDPKSLSPETFMDTVYALMQAESMTMEGVAQRMALEQIPPPFNSMMPEFGGMGPEDLFSNSLAITGMLSLISHYDLDERLEAVVTAACRRQPDASAEDLRATINKEMEDIRPKLVRAVLTSTVETLGVRRLDLPLSVRMPRGLYALLPTKVSDKDAASPTRINTQAIGVHPNNPRSQFRPTNVPAMETAVERGLQEFGL